VAAVAAERAEHVPGEALGVEADEDGFGAADDATHERDDLGAVEAENADAEVAPARRQRRVGAGDFGGRGSKHAIYPTDTVPLVCQPAVSCPVVSSSAGSVAAAGRAQRPSSSSKRTTTWS